MDVVDLLQVVVVLPMEEIAQLSHILPLTLNYCHMPMLLKSIVKDTKPNKKVELVLLLIQTFTIHSQKLRKIMKHVKEHFCLDLDGFLIQFSLEIIHK